MEEWKKRPGAVLVCRDVESVYVVWSVENMAGPLRRRVEASSVREAAEVDCKGGYCICTCDTTHALIVAVAIAVAVITCPSFDLKNNVVDSGKDH